MADTKLSALTAGAAVSAGDLFYSSQSAASRKVTGTQLKTFLLGGGSAVITTAKTLTVSNSLTLAGTDGTTITFQATDTYVGRATTDTFTNKTFDTAGTGNSFSINGVAVTANTGTGAVARAAAPTFTTPTLGVAVATSLALGGATIGANALAVTGSILFNTALIATNGGTGFASYAVGDILSADTTTTLSKVAAVASGSVLASAGTGTLPAWSNSIVLTQLQSNQIRTSSSPNSSNFGVATAVSINTQTTTAGLLFGGAANVQYRTAFNGTTNTVLTAAASYAGTIFGAQPATEATSGTHAVLANVAILAPVFTNDATAVTTDAATLLLDGPPTGITPTNPVSTLWVRSGNSRFDGAIVVGLGAAATPAIKTLSETTGIFFGNADDTIRFSNNSVQGASFHNLTSSVTSTFKCNSGTAIPAGGTAGAGYSLSSATNFGVYFGSGAPTLAAAQGSLYLRSDGTTVNNRLYVNTDGSTTWTACTTAG